MLVDDIERRTEVSTANPGGRPYDQCSPSKLIHPNGTRMAAQDRALVAAMTRAVRASYGPPDQWQAKDQGNISDAIAAYEGAGSS